MRIRYSAWISIILLGILWASLWLFSATVGVSEYDADAGETRLAIIPKNNTFYPGTTPIYSTFKLNVTVYDVSDLFTWQINVTYDPSMLNCTGASLPSDHVFAGKTYFVVPANLGSGWVLYGASLLGDPPGVNVIEGRLAQLTFKIIAVPETGSLSCGIDFTTPPTKTFMLNPVGTDISFIVENGYYKYSTVLSVESVVRDPDIPNYDETVEANATIQADNGVDVALLSYTYNMGWHNVSMTNLAPLFIGTIPSQPFGSLVEYKVYANDTLGNWIESDTYSYVVVDSIEPIISVDWTPTSPEPYVPSNTTRDNEPVLVTATIIEPTNASGVDRALFSYRVDGGEWWNTTMTLNATTGLWTATVPGHPGGLTVECFIRAFDLAENEGQAYASYPIITLITGDINGDGKVDMRDIGIVARNFGKTSP